MYNPFNLPLTVLLALSWGLTGDPAVQFVAVCLHNFGMRVMLS